MWKLPVSDLYVVNTINLVFSGYTKDAQHSKSCCKQNLLTSMPAYLKSFEIYSLQIYKNEIQELNL